MKKLFIILLTLLLLVGCTNKGKNDTSTTNVDNQTPQEAGATFLVDDKEIFLTWEELQKPENGELYDYDATAITDTQIGHVAFSSCSNLISITIPDSVTLIDEWAFEYCDNLISVIIPDSITSIGYAAFYECFSLTSIDVDINNPVYMSIDSVLFEKTDGKSTKLIRYPAGKEDTTYTIPNSVTSIGKSAFERCISLTSVTIPNSVISIGCRAFFKCSNLTSLTIPDSVTEINYWGAFEDIPHIYYNGPATYEEDDFYWGALAMN